ncbi:MAG: heavy-metal-associated domain-containing protein [Castellaniella sp.]
MLSLTVSDMTCQHCVASITRAVHSVAPQADVQVDLATHRVDISGASDAPAAIEAITQAGFSVTVL